MKDHRIVIHPRFCGPPVSGNGGYVCGRLAKFIDGPARIRLLLPAPLGIELRVERTQTGVSLLHGDSMIAEGWPTDFQIEVPDAPLVSEAEAASRAYQGFTSHWFPSCFVCGPMAGVTQVGRR